MWNSLICSPVLNFSVLSSETFKASPVWVLRVDPVTQHVHQLHRNIPAPKRPLFSHPDVLQSWPGCRPPLRWPWTMTRGELPLPVRPRSLSITVLSIAASQMAAATSEPSQSCQRVAAADYAAWPEMRLEVAAARGPLTPPASATESIPHSHSLSLPWRSRSSMQTYTWCQRRVKFIRKKLQHQVKKMQVNRTNLPLLPTVSELCINYGSFLLFEQQQRFILNQWRRVDMQP